MDYLQDYYKECIFEHLYRNTATGNVSEFDFKELKDEYGNLTVELHKDNIHLQVRREIELGRIDIYDIGQEEPLLVDCFEYDGYKRYITLRKQDEVAIIRFKESVHKAKGKVIADFVWVNTIIHGSDSIYDRRMVAKTGRLGLRVGKWIYCGNNSRPFKVSDNSYVKVVKVYDDIPEGASEELVELYIDINR